MPTSSDHRKIRVLAFAEGATLAHTARILALSAALPEQEFSLTIACSPRFQWALKDSAWPSVSLDCQAPEVFARRLANGLPIYTHRVLERYVAQDAQLIDEYAPDIIVGDFRISLGVSARKRGIHYLNLTNAYWSPNFSAPPPLPSLPLLSLLPIKLGEKLFRSTYPLATKLHAIPMEKLRRKHGMPSLNHDLGRVYCDADTVAFCDLPELYDKRVLPPNHHFLGPVLWSPPVPLPAWWSEVDTRQPLIYVTLGSSGDKRLLHKVVTGLATLGYPLAVARAGAKLDTTGLAANILVADYLPGDMMCQRAVLVVCNGGAPTTQQALAAGKPVLCIPHNLDQYMNTRRIEHARVGLSLRSDRVSHESIERVARKLIDKTIFTQQAFALGQSQVPSASQVFTSLLRKIAQSA
ncbi:MAG TPA: nucleotide disphospho-sugar-binding domain-containing protein [Rhodocyclaceae bacterium]|nr:nucleotide disphospho-sugar-binding domain-containing protein [Rhodocyclaceae bacterium]